MTFSNFSQSLTFCRYAVTSPRRMRSWNGMMPSLSRSLRAVERIDLAVREVADIGRQPHQFVADAEFVDQRGDFAIALEKVVIEVFEVIARDRKGNRLSAKVRRAFPQRDLVTGLGQGEAQPSDRRMPPPTIPMCFCLGRYAHAVLRA